MRIRTMLISSIVAAIFLSGILVVASFVVSNQNTELALSKKRAQFAAQRVSNLLVLTYEYSNNPYQRVIDQWRGAHATVVDVLTSEEKNAIPEIEEALMQAKALADNFDTLVSFKAVGKRLEDEQKTLLFNLLVADTQSLSDLIYRWENTITKNVELSDSRFHKFAVIVPTLALLMAIFLLPCFLGE